MTTLVVATAALKADEELWKKAKTKLAKAAEEADGLTILSSEWPTIHNAGVPESYHAIREKVANMLFGGRTEAGDIADALEHVRLVINGTDEAQKQAIQSQWDYE